MVKALELYLAEDHAALNTEWQRRLDYISATITKIPGVATEFSVPDVANHVPHLRISWDPKRVSATPHEVSVALRQSKPSIVIGASERGGGLSMNSFMLKPDEEKIIAEKLTQILKAHAA